MTLDRQAAFAAFRQRAPDGQVDLVDRLERDPRMVSAWPSITKRLTDPNDLQRILFLIVEAKIKADRFSEARDWPDRWERQHAELVAATETLAGFFKGIEVPEGYAELDRFKESLAWARGIIDFVHQERALALAEELPATRKKNAPLVAFCKLLCRELNDHLGQPMCAFVGTVAAVAYKFPGAIEEKTVSAAW